MKRIVRAIQWKRLAVLLAVAASIEGRADTILWSHSPDPDLLADSGGDLALARLQPASSSSWSRRSAEASSITAHADTAQPAHLTARRPKTLLSDANADASKADSPEDSANSAASRAQRGGTGPRDRLVPARYRLLGKSSSAPTDHSVADPVGMARGRFTGFTGSTSRPSQQAPNADSPRFSSRGYVSIVTGTLLQTQRHQLDDPPESSLDDPDWTLRAGHEATDELTSAAAAAGAPPRASRDLNPSRGRVGTLLISGETPETRPTQQVAGLLTLTQDHHAYGSSKLIQEGGTTLLGMNAGRMVHNAVSFGSPTLSGTSPASSLQGISAGTPASGAGPGTLTAYNATLPLPDAPAAVGDLESPQPSPERGAQPGTLIVTGERVKSGPLAVSSGTVQLTAANIGPSTPLEPPPAATISSEGSFASVNLGHRTAGMAVSMPGTYAWTIKNPNAGAGVGWDVLQLSGTLDVGGGSGILTLNLSTLNAAGAPGYLEGFDPNTRYEWLIATTGGPVTGLDLDRIQINPANFMNVGAGQGFFMLSAVTDGLALEYYPGLVETSFIPEPEEYAALAGLGLLGFALWRRRSRPGQRGAK